MKQEIIKMSDQTSQALVFLCYNSQNHNVRPHSLQRLSHASPAHTNGTEMLGSLLFGPFIQYDSVISALLLTTCRSFLEASGERILLPWPPQNTQRGVMLPIRDMWKIEEFLYIPWWHLNAPHYTASSGFKPQSKTCSCGHKHEALQPAPQSRVTVDSTDSVQSAWHADFLYFQKCVFPVNIFSFWGGKGFVCIP